MDCLMMLRDASRAGITVNADGERLVVRGPKRQADLAARILEHKSGVLEALRTPRSRWDVVVAEVQYRHERLTSLGVDPGEPAGAGRLLDEVGAALRGALDASKAIDRWHAAWTAHFDHVEGELASARRSSASDLINRAFDPRATDTVRAIARGEIRRRAASIAGHPQGAWNHDCTEALREVETLNAKLRSRPLSGRWKDRDR